MQYIPYHVHTELSLLDSTTNYKKYIDLCVQHGIPALGITEHGNMFNWYKKYQYAQKNGIKLIMGCEVYLTETLAEKVRDNYHTVLLAKNSDGFSELLQLISTANDPEHFYYDPRITFDEFLNVSDNIISTSACLASPLNRLDRSNSYYEQLATKYTYYEIQPHKAKDQIEYNKHLYELSKAFNKPLILGTDTHSATEFDAECCDMVKTGQKFEYDDYGLVLTFWEPDALYETYKYQEIPKDAYQRAIQNTLELQNIEKLTFDTSVKYPDLYENADEMLDGMVWDFYRDKIDKGIFPDTHERRDRLNEEIPVFKKQGMSSFMLFMSELVRWCHSNDIPTGFCRGSVGGSFVAYVLDIIDLDPIKWKAIFSRFVNADRISLGDIDIDFAPEDRDTVYDYIYNRFGIDKTAHILTLGTAQEKKAIETICRGIYPDMPNDKRVQLAKTIKNELIILRNKYTECYNELSGKDEKELCFLKHEEYLENIPEKYQTEFKSVYSEFESLVQKYPDVFHYYRTTKGTILNKGKHASAIVASPITLANNIGLCMNDGNWVTQLDMEELHDLNYVKYDILGLKNIGIIKQTYKLINQQSPKSHEIDWEDPWVWEDIITSRAGIFQFEGDYAFSLLKQIKPEKINDMSLCNAALRPSGKSYRHRLMAREINYNPSEEIDKLLADNYGYLVYQEDTIRFLSDICGLTGAEGESVRKFIADKKRDKLQPFLPKILEGYCNYSSKPREEAEEEAKRFLQIIEDSARYQFGYNHSTGYSMIGYMCAMLRYYYPTEFLTAFLNCAQNDDDIQMGQELAQIEGIKILPIQFGKSQDVYMLDSETNSIYKGIASIKYMSATVAKELYHLAKTKPETLTTLLFSVHENTSCDMRQLEILIKLGFFPEVYGSMKKQLQLFQLWRNKKLWQRKQFNKKEANELGLTPLIIGFSNETEKLYNNIDIYGFLKAYEMSLPNDDFTIYKKISFQQELLGYIQYVDENMPRGYVYVTDIDTRYSPRAQVYGLKSGKSMTVKIYKSKRGKGMPGVSKYFKDEPFDAGDILKVKKVQKQPKRVKNQDTGKWEEIPGTEEVWVVNYEKVSSI